MATENAIVLKSQVDRYNLMVVYVKTIMVDGRDYGKVPGTSKPTLLKPGAEKLNSLFNLFPVFTVSDKLIDWERGIFFYQYECRLVSRNNGDTWGSGLGSCNSKESKYRYRYVATDKRPTKDEAAELKARGLGRWRKDGDKWVWMERIDNDQIYDIVNTIDKMAQKRALIAATLIACNASEFFTQDVEDIPGFGGEVIETEFTETTEKPKGDITADLAHLAGIIDSDGNAYLMLSSENLSSKSIGIGKALAKNGLTDEQKAEYQVKRDAIKEILEWRSNHAA